MAALLVKFLFNRSNAPFALFPYSWDGWFESYPSACGHLVTIDKLNVVYISKENNLKKLFAIAAVVGLSTGCASIVNESGQPMKIETKTEAGETITGAECTISNDYGSISAKSGSTATVRRSSKDMDIICKHPENPDANARAISRANAGLAGNIIFGGGIGAIIDHTKGTAYTYPTWVQLVFGKTLVFDRSMEKDGMPVAGTEPVNTASK